MADPQSPPTPPAGRSDSEMRRHAIFCFGIFAMFFLFYVGAAVLQTPALAAVASTPALGMPLGLLLSMLIFPVSWILIVLFFAKGR